jgi:predicted HTH domain antitoxin
MQIQVTLPDDLVHCLETKWGNLEHKLQEMIILQAYSEGSISVGKVQELLGIKTRLAIDAFLQDRGIELNYGEAELEIDRHTHE